MDCSELPRRLAELARDIAQNDPSVNSYDDVVKVMERMFPEEKTLRTDIADDYIALVEEEKAAAEAEATDKAEKAIDKAKEIIKVLGKESKAQDKYKKLIREYETMTRGPKKEREAAARRFENARIKFLEEAYAADKPMVDRILRMKSEIDRIRSGQEKDIEEKKGRKVRDPKEAKLWQELSDLKEIQKLTEEIEKLDEIIETGIVPPSGKKSAKPPRVDYPNAPETIVELESLRAERDAKRLAVSKLAKGLRESERASLQSREATGRILGRIEEIQNEILTGVLKDIESKPPQEITPEMAANKQELKDLLKMREYIKRIKALKEGPPPQITSGERVRYGNEWWASSKLSSLAAEEKFLREEAKKLAEGLKEPKPEVDKEAQALERIQKRMDVVMDKLSSGDFTRETKVKPEKQVSPEVAARRKELADLTSLLKIYQDIEDLDRQIAAGKRDPKAQKLPESKWGKLSQMEAIRADKRKQLNEMTKVRKEKTRVDVEVKLVSELEAELADLSERAAKNIPLEPAKKKKAKAQSEQVTQLKDQIKSLKRKLKFRDNVNSLRADLETLDVAALKEKYTPKPRPIPEYDADVDRMQIEADKLLDQIHMEIERARPKSLILRGITGTQNMMIDMLTSLDMGHIMRQGNFMMFSRPLTTLKVLTQMLTRGHTENQFRQTMKEIERHPDYLTFARDLEWENPLDQSHKRNEEIRGSIARKLPILGRGVKWSQYTYATFMNRLRMESASAMLRSLGTEPTKADIEFIANTINTFTGKGNLGRFKGAQPLLDQVFLATRWRLSRFETALGMPLWKAMFGKDISPAMKWIVARQYARYAIFQGITRSLLLTGLLLMDDPDEEGEIGFEWDTRSSQFGKLYKFTGTHKVYMDLMGGLARPISLIKQTTGGETKSAKTGKIQELEVGWQRFKPALDWLRQGFGPFAGLVFDLAIAKNDPIGMKIFEGEYEDAISQADEMFNIGLEQAGVISKDEGSAKRAIRYALSRNLPIMVQDLAESFSDEGAPNKWAQSALNFVGSNVTSIPTKD